MITNIVSNSGLTVVFSDGPRMIHKSSPAYAEALAALAEQDIERLRLLMDPRASLRKFSNEEIAFQPDGSYAVDGSPIGQHCTDLVNLFHNKKMPWGPLSAFIRNRARNPSTRARNGLDTFMACERLPITTDGCLLALKLFTNDWVDSDTGTYLAKPGTTIEFPRENIYLNARRGPEKGFSAGSRSYVDHNSTFVGKVGIVKVNPADVVGVYSSPVGELITCRYTVIREADIQLLGNVHDGSTGESLF